MKEKNFKFPLKNWIHEDIPVSEKAFKKAKKKRDKNKERKCSICLKQLICPICGDELVIMLREDWESTRILMINGDYVCEHHGIIRKECRKTLEWRAMAQKTNVILNQILDI